VRRGAFGNKSVGGVRSRCAGRETGKEGKAGERIRAMGSNLEETFNGRKGKASH